MYKQRFILILMTVIFLITTNVYADEVFLYSEEETKNITYPKGVLKIEISEEKETYNQFFSLKSDAIPDFETYIKENLRNHVDEIDVSMYNMKVGNFVAKVSEYCDELMVATGLIDCDAKEISSGIPQAYHTITKWRPVYLFSKEQDAEARAFVKQEVKKYADAVRVLTNDPLGQLLLVHDMLVKDCEYDVNYKANGYNNKSFSAYGFFKDKLAVCQGYAEAFYLIAKELGYDCGFYLSYSIGHIWNYIKVDDEFYQVDMTWNDTVADEDGEELAVHEFFLASDAKMAALEHGVKDTWYQSMDEKPDCGTRFETDYLFNIVEPFTTEFINGKYVVSATMVRNDGAAVFNETFKTDNLHTGPVIPAVTTSDDSYCYFSYYYTKSTSWIDVYVGQLKGDKLLKGVKMGTLSNVDVETGKELSRGDTITLGVPKTGLISGCDNIKMFLWENGMMSPLSLPANHTFSTEDV